MADANRRCSAKFRCYRPHINTTDAGCLDEGIFRMQAEGPYGGAYHVSGKKWATKGSYVAFPYAEPP